MTIQGVIKVIIARYPSIMSTAHRSIISAKYVTGNFLRSLQGRGLLKNMTKNMDHGGIKGGT